jgi:DNA repair exonuclease SbcCD ATPase subunit
MAGIQNNEILNSLVELFDMLDKKIKQTNDSMVKLEKAIKDVNNTGSGADAKVLVETTKKLSEETEKLTALQKAELQIKNQIIAGEAKLVASYSDESEQLRQIKVETQALNKQKQDQAKLDSQLTSEYDKQSIVLSKLKKEIKDLVLAGKTEDEQTKQKIKQYQDLNSKIRAVDEVVGDFQKNVGNYPKVLIPARQELKNLTAAMSEMKAAGKDGTAEYLAMAQRAGHLKDAIGDARAEIKLFSSDTRNLDLAVGAINAVGSAFQIAQGAAALLGVEDKELAKSIQKMMAVQSILNGLTEVQNALQSESAFMQGVLAVKTKVVSAAQWLWNAALAANPITLVVAGVVALGAAIGALIVYFSDSEESIKNQNVALDGTVLATKEAVDAHNQHIEVMRDLDLQLSVTTGKITDFEKSIIDLAATYNKKVVEIQAATGEKLKDVNGFWGTVWTTIKGGGNVFAAVAENAKESTDIIIDSEQAIADQQEILNKEIELKNAEKTKKDLEQAKKLAADKAKIHDKEYEDAQKRLDKIIELPNKEQDEKNKIANEILKNDKKQSEEWLKSKKEDSEAYAELDIINNQWRIDAENQQNEDALKKEADLLEEKKQMYYDLGISIGQTFVNLLEDGKLTFKEFGKLVITSALDLMQKQLLIGSFEILLKQISSKGFFGIATAGILTGIVNGAFALVKSKVMNFATGTEYVNGAGTETSDSVPANLSRGERVIPANINKQLLGISNNKLPNIVANGLINTQKMESILEEVRYYNKMTSLYLSNGVSGYRYDGFEIVQDWKTGETRKKPLI